MIIRCKLLDSILIFSTSSFLKDSYQSLFLPALPEHNTVSESLRPGGKTTFIYSLSPHTSPPINLYVRFRLASTLRAQSLMFDTKLYNTHTHPWMHWTHIITHSQQEPQHVTNIQLEFWVCLTDNVTEFYKKLRSVSHSHVSAQTLMSLERGHIDTTCTQTHSTCFQSQACLLHKHRKPQFWVLYTMLTYLLWISNGLSSLVNI